MKTSRVVHCNREAYDVYIGRGGPWGNPFRMYGEGDRDRVIREYRRWLRAEIDAGRISEEDVLALRGKTLGCWCAPRACHGDVLLEEAERLAQRAAKK